LDRVPDVPAARRLGAGSRIYTETVAQARAIAFLATVEFVKARYGKAAHESVFATLPADSQIRLASIRDTEWIPLRDLAAYSLAAQQTLAPDDGQFFRNLGRSVGRFYRQQGGFAPMVPDPVTAMRLGPTMWRLLYDTGSMEIIPSGSREASVRICGLRTSRALCETNCGAIEGVVGNDLAPARIEKRACVLDGAPCCEMRLVWE
jgi:hypothetical protein